MKIFAMSVTIYTIFSPRVIGILIVELTDILDKILQKNPIDRITLQEIRNHKWLEGYDCPIIPPKISGKVDSSKLGQIVKSINSEKSYICYTFNNYEAPVNRHLANSRIDATRRQRSNSAISARKKSYSIGKDARPALDTILGKDARLNPEVSVGRGSISGRDFRPAAESSAGANSVLSKDGRPMAEDSMRSNFISMNSSVESDFNGSKPFAESSVGRGGILVDKQWCESSPVEASPLRIKSTEEEAPAVRGPLSIRGALGFRRGSFSRKIAVPLRQDGSFISKAVPTSPREGS
jgi:serine/threonine protein kinase